MRTQTSSRKLVAKLERDHPESDALSVGRGLLQTMEGRLEKLTAQRNRLKARYG
jgi:hypothetical protein